MLLKSYSFMEKEIDIAFFHEVWNEVSDLKWYFYKFAGTNSEEAMQRTLFHTLTHFSPDRGYLSAYVKKLAREITKDNSKLVYVDFLEQTLSEDDDNPDGERKSTVDTGSIRDFSQDIVDEMELDEDRRPEVVGLALEFMEKFLMLCDALQRHDTTTRYYPDIFIKSCMDISQKCRNFNQLCLDVYAEYGDDFKWFLDVGKANPQWREADFVMLQNSVSRRVKFVNPVTGAEVEDADLDAFVLQGKLGEGESQKRIIKVGYYPLWEYMCDLVDAPETNEMKFVIGDKYVVRTIGGSVGTLNTSLYRMYDLVRSEILTNVLQDTGGRVLNVGSESFYLLCSSSMTKSHLSRSIQDCDICVPYTDITDSIR